MSKNGILHVELLQLIQTHSSQIGGMEMAKWVEWAPSDSQTFSSGIFINTFIHDTITAICLMFVDVVAAISIVLSISVYVQIKKKFPKIVIKKTTVEKTLGY